MGDRPARACGAGGRGRGESRPRPHPPRAAHILSLPACRAPTSQRGFLSLFRSQSLPRPGKPFTRRAVCHLLCPCTWPAVLQAASRAPWDPSRTAPRLLGAPSCCQNPGSLGGRGHATARFVSPCGAPRWSSWADGARWALWLSHAVCVLGLGRAPCPPRCCHCVTGSVAVNLLSRPGPPCPPTVQTRTFRSFRTQLNSPRTDAPLPSEAAGAVGPAEAGSCRPRTALTSHASCTPAPRARETLSRRPLSLVGKHLGPPSGLARPQPRERRIVEDRHTGAPSPRRPHLVPTTRRTN